MKDKDKNLQHMMMSFALMGGMLVSPRHKPGRTVSRPQDYVPNPRKPRNS